MIKKIKSWWRRRKNRRVIQERNQLREFVYLDEVSVTSLVSSRKGAVPHEITDKLTDTVRASSTSNVEASTKVLKSSFGSVLESTRTQDRQVLRKATIQATFKDLYEEELDTMALRSLDSKISIPEIPEIQAMLTSPELSAPKALQWMAGQEQLTRGRLVEVEVELQADSVFQVSAFVSSFLDMFAESSDLAAQVNSSDAEWAREFNQILEQLLVGLVPIKCRLVDYRAILLQGKEYLIHNKLLQALPESGRPDTLPAYLVGVTEQDLFWKDIRRVLFSEARVKALCRLNHVGVRSSWNAVKLADMIGNIVPGFAQEFDSFVSNVLQAVATDGNLQQPQDAAHIEVLVTYGNLLAQEGGISLTDADLSEIRRLAVENSHLLASSIPESRVAFRKISQFLADRHQLTVSPEMSHDLRLRARDHVELSENSSTQPTITSGQQNSASMEERYLDAEIIAIYW